MNHTNIIHLQKSKELQFIKKCLLYYFFAPLSAIIACILFITLSGLKTSQITPLFISQHPSIYFFLLAFLLCILGFVAGAIGFYQLSKLSRNLQLFEYFTFSFVALTLCSLLGYLLPNQKNTLSLMGNAFSIFYLYKLYRELSLCTKERYFFVGFRLFLFAMFLALIGVLMGQTLSIAFLMVAMLLISVALILLGRAFLHFSQVCLK
ncbi:hypothetical protein [Helicobacter cetorum]|uniref:Uncharacterized protein n=1 Tax=Helicobacter cetorum (strain ATCC BAA-429 / MIT 00-7128) TaxID=182217 RepID=I0EM48_HELC0|nr:hypothetical protein [Helicobacter cetorum]AFI04017.1 hypothetical protein HCW_03690 [Helicobacter cetorum MIT 00-7128]